MTKISTVKLTHEELGLVRNEFEGRRLAWIMSYIGAPILKKYFRLEKPWPWIEGKSKEVLKFEPMPPNDDHEGGFPYNCGCAVIEAFYCDSEEYIKKQLLCFAYDNRKHVFATTNQDQKGQFNMLKKCGFEVIRGWSVNPNSGNRIAVLLYTIP